MAAHQEITVTSGVRPVAVVRYDHDIEAVRETLDILSDPATLESIEQGRNEIARGDFVTKDEIIAMRDQMKGGSS